MNRKEFFKYLVGGVASLPVISSVVKSQNFNSDTFNKMSEDENKYNAAYEYNKEYYFYKFLTRIQNKIINIEEDIRQNTSNNEEGREYIKNLVDEKIRNEISLDRKYEYKFDILYDVICDKTNNPLSIQEQKIMIFDICFEIHNKKYINRATLLLNNENKVASGGFVWFV